MSLSGIGPISDYDAWRLANPDDDGGREDSQPDADRVDELYERWKEGEL